MPNVHGIEFNANQSDLVKDLVRELIKDGNCSVYAMPHMKPHGELRMASIAAAPGEPRAQHDVFLRIRPGVNEATVVRPLNAKAGEPIAKLTKFSRPEMVTIIRMAWGDSLTAEAVQEESRIVPTFSFDATKYTPAVNTDYLQQLEESAVNQKTQDELEAERKEKLLWSIAENRLLNESSRVQALRLLQQW